MATIIIGLFAVIMLMIYKAESTVNNEDILVKIHLFHLKVKTRLYRIVNDPYKETRQKSTKWIAFLFMLVAVLQYVSILFLLSIARKSAKFFSTSAFYYNITANLDISSNK